MLRAVADYLEAKGEDDAAGADLQYDPRLSALQNDARGKTLYDGTGPSEVARYEAPDWGALWPVADKLALETLDLRVWLLALRIRTGIEGAAGLAFGLDLICRGCEQHWSVFHPKLDESETDPFEQALVRLNTLRELVDPAGLLRIMEAMPLIAAQPIGRFSLREVMLAQGRARPRSANEAVPQAELVQGVIEQSPEADGTRAAVDRCADTAAELVAFLEDKVGRGALDLSPVTQLLDHAAAALAPREKVAEASADVTSAVTEAPKAANGSATMSGVPNGAIETREQVLASLGQILVYYQRKEPTSPIPLLIQRVQRLVPMSFMELMTDMAPGAVKPLQELAGAQGEGDKGKKERT